jgi:hypothetical protein
VAYGAYSGISQLYGYLHIILVLRMSSFHLYCVIRILCKLKMHVKECDKFPTPKFDFLVMIVYFLCIRYEIFILTCHGQAPFFAISPFIILADSGPLFIVLVKISGLGRLKFANSGLFPQTWEFTVLYNRNITGNKLLVLAIVSSMLLFSILTFILIFYCIIDIFL